MSKKIRATVLLHCDVAERAESFERIVSIGVIKGGLAWCSNCGHLDHDYIVWDTPERRTYTRHAV
jgi:hypothetical protein